MTTKATRDVIDLKTRPIDFNEGDGLKVVGDCGADFALDGVPIGITTPCSAGFTDITMSGGIDMAGNDLDMNGGKISNADTDSGPTGERWITETESDDRDADVLETAQNFAEALISQALPAGIIVPYGGDSAPSGWVLCAGQEINRVTFARLFDVLGTKFGPGDGASTFNVPDLRGRVLAGIDNMGGVDANRITGAWAEFVGNASGDENQDHDHPFEIIKTETFRTSAPSHQDSEGPGAFSGPADNHTHDVTVNFAYSSNTDVSAVSTIQPTMVVNYIIKA